MTVFECVMTFLGTVFVVQVTLIRATLQTHASNYTNVEVARSRREELRDERS